MTNSMKKEYGLVFAGGGTKGAYQVGVSKALNELGIKIKVVSGASIGAINGALFVQNNVQIMEELYNNVQAEDIVGVSEKVTLNKQKNLLSFENALKLAGEYAKNNGISNEPLRNLLNNYLDIDKIYESQIDYGIITFDTKTGEGVELFKNDIPKEKLCDYILASACFPIFKPQSIDNNRYIDGGLSDNMPVNMLVKKGYKNIILIDISGIGVTRKNINSDVYVKVIRPNEDLGGTFDFNHENIMKNINLGYYDTLKSFRKLIGNYFYFELKVFNELLQNFTLSEISGLEFAGKQYKIDRFKLYSYDEFLKLIKLNYEKEESEYKKIKKNLSASNIASYIKKGASISLAMDIITNYPTLYSNGVVKKLIGDYISSAQAIQTLRNTIDFEE